MINEKVEYINIDLEKLPSRGIYYNENTYIKIRKFSEYEKKVILEFETNNSIIKKLEKIKIVIEGIDTNMDKEDLCYTDTFYLFFYIHSLTYKEIEINHNGNIFYHPNIPSDYLLSNPTFSKKEDFKHDKSDITFCLPTIYNVSKAISNTITLCVKKEINYKDKFITDRLAIVPYLQYDKINDNIIEFINEHAFSITEENIMDIKKFIKEKENMVLGQNVNITKDNKEVQLLINLDDLI